MEIKKNFTFRRQTHTSFLVNLPITLYTIGKQATRMNYTAVQINIMLAEVPHAIELDRK